MKKGIVTFLIALALITIVMMIYNDRMTKIENGEMIQVSESYMK